MTQDTKIDTEIQLWQTMPAKYPVTRQDGQLEPDDTRRINTYDKLMEGY